jgi:hypothetical protein
VCEFGLDHFPRVNDSSDWLDVSFALLDSRSVHDEHGSLGILWILLQECFTRAKEFQYGTVVVYRSLVIAEELGDSAIDMVSLNASCVFRWYQRDPIDYPCESVFQELKFRDVQS